MIAYDEIVKEYLVKYREALEVKEHFKKANVSEWSMYNINNTIEAYAAIIHLFNNVKRKAVTQ